MEPAHVLPCHQREKGGSMDNTRMARVLVVLVLVSSDALLAVLVWLAGYELQSIFGRWGDFPRPTAIVVGVFAVAVWIGLRSLMGLYPGYGLSPAERLRRHTYSVVSTFAAVSLAIALDFGAITSKFGPIDLVGRVPRLLLALGFVGLLLLYPLVQGLVRRGLWRLSIWDSLADDGPR
jgi:hypothetical protein